MAVSAALYIKYVLTHQPFHPTLSRMTESEAILFMLCGGIIPICDLPYDTQGKGLSYIVFDGMKYFCDMAYPWLLHPRVAKIRYEDFTKDPVRTLTQSFDAVGVEVSEDNIRNVMKYKNFVTATSGRVIGVEDKSSHYRKGIVGDHKNYFTDLHRAVCKHHIGEDLIRLGYEKSLEW
jgi:hypothetical protein